MQCFGCAINALYTNWWTIKLWNSSAILADWSQQSLIPVSKDCNLSSGWKVRHWVGFSVAGRSNKVEIKNMETQCNWCLASNFEMFAVTCAFHVAVGSDGFCRLWEVKTGKILAVVVHPHPPVKTSFPSVCLSDTFGGVAYPGLILGSNNELHFYARLW